MKKGKRRGLRKREALKIETYRQAFKVAIRHGRKYGVAGDRAEDIASDAYLVQARGALKRLTAKDPKALARRVAFGGVADGLRRLMTERGGFEAGEVFEYLDDPAAPLDITDLGRSAARCRLVCDHGPDPVPPTPLWQRMVQLVLESATPEMRRVARAFTQCWNAEEAREKVKMTPWNFYRLRKKLKILLTPCFTEYREWLRRLRRVRGW